MRVLVSPHNDDETLFAAFTILRERPLVVVVFDGHVQRARGFQVTAEQRRDETRAAMAVLGAEVKFLGLRDDDAGVTTTRVADALRGPCHGAEVVWAPAAEQDGHPQHNMVATACDQLLRAGDVGGVRSYHTYTTAGKTIAGREVRVEDGAWIALKHRALACYVSQLVPGLNCWQHFMRDMREHEA